ncbi:MAG: hypothetical protein ACLFTK_11075 [Anaerolineales bacterium]
MPETLDFMIYGYSAAFILLGGLVASIWWRFRQLQADETTLQNLEADIQEDAPALGNRAAAGTD